MSCVISANRLQDGLVVYLGPQGEWVGDLDRAALFATKADGEAALATARHGAGANLVLDPLIVDIAEDAEGRRAVTLRNAIRALGPTIDFHTSAAARAARS